MSPDEFRQELLKHKAPTREMILSPGDPGGEPVTKIGGSPWWPESISRPTCEHGHLMSFINQVLLTDVPALSQLRDTLLSFHYCETCLRGEAGKSFAMSFGWNDTTGNRGPSSVFDRD